MQIIEDVNGGQSLESIMTSLHNYYESIKGKGQQKSSSSNYLLFRNGRIMRSSAGITITNEKYSFSLHFMGLISDLLRLLKNDESLFSLRQS